MIFFTPYDKIQTIKAGGAIDGFTAEEIANLKLAFDMVIDSGIEREMYLKDGAPWLRFVPKINALVSQEMCMANVGLGGDVHAPPLYLEIPDVGSELPEILNPRTIMELDATGEEVGDHIETWAERARSTHWDLGVDENNKGWLPLTVGNKNGPYLTLAEAMGIGAIVSEIPGVNVVAD